ncbi:hypothetical protein Hdeb2414_s0002g00056711 [Helianthus debilis subsp. tardiflorus]
MKYNNIWSQAVYIIQYTQILKSIFTVHDFTLAHQINPKSPAAAQASQFTSVAGRSTLRPSSPAPLNPSQFTSSLLTFIAFSHRCRFQVVLAVTKTHIISVTGAAFNPSLQIRIFHLRCFCLNMCFYLIRSELLLLQLE